MHKIPVGEIQFIPSSYRDPNGRVFEWNGQLYRAIKGRNAHLYREIFADGTVQGLVEKELLVQSELTPFSLDGYGLVIRHERVPFVSACFEWTPTMLKHAALLTLDLNLELAKSGLGMIDIHPWNILFDGPKPLHIDFSAIETVEDYDESWYPAFEMYHRFYVYPLLLMSIGQGRIARWLLHDLHTGILKHEFVNLYHPRKLPKQWLANEIASWMRLKVRHHLPLSLRQVLRRGSEAVKRKRLSGQVDYQPRVQILEELRRQVNSIDLPLQQTEWTDYYEGDFQSFSSSEEWTLKQHNVYEILRRLQPDSVLDIGSNRGWYSQLAASSGSRVVAFDIVESSVELLYQDAKKKRLTILPLVMNIISPSPGYGLSNMFVAPASDRLKCDLVLALALVHHLALRAELTFDQIVQALDQFCNKQLLVEFVDRDDRWGQEMWSERFPDYTLNAFISALNKKFHSIEILESYPSTRHLLLCEK